MSRVERRYSQPDAEAGLSGGTGVRERRGAEPLASDSFRKTNLCEPLNQRVDVRMNEKASFNDS